MDEMNTITKSEQDIAVYVLEAHVPRDRLKLKKTATGFTCCCPFHEDNTPSFSGYIGADGRFNWHCFGEDIGGHLMSLVLMLVRKQAPDATMFDACNWLIDNGIVTKDFFDNSGYERDYYLFMYMKNSNYALLNDTRARGVRTYLKNRGITKELISKYPIGFYTNTREVTEWADEYHVPEEIVKEYLLPSGKGKPEYYLICYEFDVFGSIAALQVRDVAKELTGAPKKRFYLGSTENTSPRYFGIPTSLANLREAILVEGQFDMMAMQNVAISSGMDYTLDDFGHTALVLAVHGTSGFAGITKYLLEHNVKVTVFPDMDEAGMDAMTKLIQSYPEVKIMLPEELAEEDGVKDPYDYCHEHPEEVFDLFDNRISGWKYKLNQFIDGYEGAEDSDEQRTVIRNAISFAKQLNGMSATEFIEEWAEEIEADKDVIMQEVKSSGKYRIDKDPITFGTYAKHITKEGLEIWEPISPVVCKQLPGIIVDSGLAKETNIQLQVEVANQKPCVVNLSAAEYENDHTLNTAIVKALGANAFTNPKNMLALREASKEIADDGAVVMVQQYTGWSSDYKKFYMPGAVIAADGVGRDDSISVELGGNPAFLSKYGFCTDYTEADLVEAKNVLRNYALDVLPRDTMLMLVTAMFSPLVYPFIKAVKPTVVWIAGQTGFRKTSTVMALMNLYGQFDGGEDSNHDTWQSTETAITITGFKLKHIPYLVDDYKQNSVAPQKVTHIIQGAADGNARSRSNRSLTLNGVYNIKGLLISTGEQAPDFGEASVSGRLLLLTLNQRADSEKLTYIQQHNAKLSSVTVEFIKFLINKNIDSNALKNEFLELRKQFQSARGHSRTAETAAAMTLVWRFVSEFLGWAELDKQFSLALAKTVNQINIACERESVAVLFVDVLTELIADGTLNMINLANRSMYGFNADRFTIGYYDDEYEYIHPVRAIGEVNKCLKDINHPLINFSRDALYAQLRSSGLSICDAKGDNPKFPAQTGIGTSRCLKFSRGTLVAGGENVLSNRGANFSEADDAIAQDMGFAPQVLPVEATVPF